MEFPNKYIYLKTLELEGETFFLSIPTATQWKKIMDNIPLEEVHNLFKLHDVRDIFCQVESLVMPKLTRLPIDDYKQDVETKRTTLNFSYEDTGFIPMLIPVTHSENFIHGVMGRDMEFSVSEGFSFVVHGTFQQNDSCQVAPLPGVRKKRLKFDICETVCSEPSYTMSWIQVDGCYVGLSCLAKGFSFENLVKFFGTPKYDMSFMIE